MGSKIVITGMGVVSPLGNEIETFWKRLCAGESGIRYIDIFDEAVLEALPSKIAGIAPEVVPEDMNQKDVRRHSRYSLFAVEVSDQAIKQSGFDISKENPYRCGVVFGSGIGGLQEINEDSVRMHESGARRVSPLMIPKGLTNMASGIVGIRHGFNGPNKAIVTACATATQCIGAAADMIRAGKADVMLAGGSESTIIPFAIAGFCAMKALCSNRNDTPEIGSRPFDADRSGFVMGEGAGAFVLETEEHAKKRGAPIFAEVAGMGETCDAYHITAPRPDGSGPAEAMLEALRDAKVNKEEVDYFNPHGTSTKLNDASEAKALRKVFGDNMPPSSSTKSMVGHLLGAAGAVEALACVMSIRDGIIHPNINYETPDPECDIDIVANEAREARVNIAMSNSLGFGGHNASLILRKYE